MDVKLCETNVTGATIEQLLSKSTELHLNSHRLIKIEAKITGEGQGFTSKVFRVSLTWSEPSPGLPKSVIVKVIGGTAIHDVFTSMSKDETEKLQATLFHAHNVECKVYDLKGLQAIVPMPRCYANVESAGKDPGIMILEDLGDAGFVLPLTTWGIGLTSGQLDQVLYALASVHAWSVNNTEWRKVIPSLSEFNILNIFVENLGSMFPQSKAAYPDLFQNLDEEKVRKYINSENVWKFSGAIRNFAIIYHWSWFMAISTSWILFSKKQLMAWVTNWLPWSIGKLRIKAALWKI